MDDPDPQTRQARRRQARPAQLNDPGVAHPRIGPGARAAAEALVAVAARGEHGRYLLQLVQQPQLVDVAGVQDRVTARERVEHLRPQLGPSLRDMRVGDEAQPHTRGRSHRDGRIPDVPRN